MSEQTIAERLRVLRASKNEKQDVVAEACDISRVALARYETGQRAPRVEIAARLADYYGVSVDYILGRDEKTEPLTDNRSQKRNEKIEEATKILQGMTDEEYAMALNILRAMKK